MNLNEIVKLTLRLIRFKSTANNEDQLRASIDYCARYLKKGNIIIRRYEKNKKPSLVATYQRTKCPQIFFVGHLDVVGAKNNQFIPTIKNGRIYGRGAFDMKGQVAVMLKLFKDFSQKRTPPSIGIMLTTDEEIGGINGVNYLLSNHHYRCEVAFVPDAGRNFRLILEQKGVLHVKVTAYGKSAHGSRPWRGKNAIDKLIKLYCWLKKKFPQPKGEKDWKPSLNLGKIQGGVATNQVPDKAEMFLDFRYPVTWNENKILKMILSFPYKKDKDYTVEVIARGDVCYTDKNNKYVKLFREAAKEILKKPLNIGKSCGACDGRFFSKYGIPTIRIQQIGANGHADNEWTDIDSLGKFYLILERFIEKVNQSVY